jgi:purine-nucleoside phosphorylase
LTDETLFGRAEQAAAALRARCAVLPEIAVVLGSGLGAFADAVRDAVAIDYDEIPHWPAARVVGHAGRLVVGTISGKRVVVLSGRAHLYEGYDLATVAFPTRVMGRLGVKRLILTNASGGVNTSFAAGSIMILDDHINLLGTSPLVGPNDDRLGPRFPDMSEVYSSDLRRITDDVARERRIAVVHGVYGCLPGPSYETPAEIRFLRTIGVDAVGMSTVPEAIAARHMGIDVLGISCVANMAAGVLPQPLNHEDILETARRVQGTFVSLLEGVIERL